jgi:hypothetical protein
MRYLVAALLVFITFPVSADPSAERLKLSGELAELMQVRKTLEGSTKECEQSKSSYDARTDFKADQKRFGGITPESAYWPEIEAMYRRYWTAMCNYLSVDKLFSIYVGQIAATTSNDDLRAAIKWWSSPAGRRMQQASFNGNMAIQKYAITEMGPSFRSASQQYMTELDALIAKFKKEPR